MDSSLTASRMQDPRQRCVGARGAGGLRACEFFSGSGPVFRTDDVQPSSRVMPVMKSLMIDAFRMSMKNAPTRGTTRNAFVDCP